jgi:hypothetical protein
MRFEKMKKGWVEGAFADSTYYSASFREDKKRELLVVKKTSKKVIGRRSTHISTFAKEIWNILRFWEYQK